MTATPTTETAAEQALTEVRGWHLLTCSATDAESAKRHAQFAMHAAASAAAAAAKSGTDDDWSAAARAATLASDAMQAAKAK